jgi:hypothetical protein
VSFFFVSLFHVFSRSFSLHALSLLSFVLTFPFFIPPSKTKSNTHSRSRGIDGVTARRVLVQSFGAEVTAALPGKGLRKRVEAAAGAALSKVKLDASEE